MGPRTWEAEPTNCVTHGTPRGGGVSRVEVVSVFVEVCSDGLDWYRVIYLNCRRVVVLS